ncbi:hypothetical protein LCGC14_2018020, partial [marine sediment metagenome]
MIPVAAAEATPENIAAPTPVAVPVPVAEATPAPVATPTPVAVPVPAAEGVAHGQFVYPRGVKRLFDVVEF